MFSRLKSIFVRLYIMIWSGDEIVGLNDLHYDHMEATDGSFVWIIAKSKWNKFRFFFHIWEIKLHSPYTLKFYPSRLGHRYNRYTGKVQVVQRYTCKIVEWIQYIFSRSTQTHLHVDEKNLFEKRKLGRRYNESYRLLTNVWHSTAKIWS